MRCKACNALLTEKELQDLDPLTGAPTELCDVCIDASEEDFGACDE